MVFLIGLYLVIYGFLTPTEAMIESSFSMVRGGGDSAPLCAMDQPSAVKSTNSAIWCGIECITSSSSSMCHAFSYFETTNKCNMFFFAPTNYAVEDDCVTYGPVAESQAYSVNIPTSAAQPVNAPSSTANGIVASAADSTAASTIAASAASTFSINAPPVEASAAPTANIPDIISTQQASATGIISTAEPPLAASAATTTSISDIISTQEAGAANTISAIGLTTVSAAAPTANIPDSISTPQAAATPSTIDVHVVSPAAATTASSITTTGSNGQLVQATATMSAQSLTTAPTTSPSAGGLKCDQKIAPASRLLLQQNTGSGLDQTWSAFKFGFNVSTGGYWIGNENLYKMTNNGTKCRLCIDMEDTGGTTWYYAFYSSFIIGKESDGYNCTVAGYDGDVGVDSFSVTNGRKFIATDTTPAYPCLNFASTLKGGWWYPCSATQIALNGVGSTGFYWTTTPVNKFFKWSYMWIGCP